MKKLFAIMKTLEKYRYYFVKTTILRSTILPVRGAHYTNVV